MAQERQTPRDMPREQRNPRDSRLEGPDNQDRQVQVTTNSPTGKHQALPYASWGATHLDKFRPGQGKWGEARCPLHEDRKPSLRLDGESGGYICNSPRCSKPTGHARQLADAAGLDTAGMPDGPNGKASNLEPKTEYPYPSEDGQPFGLVVRFWDSQAASKTFRQKHWEGGSYAWGGGAKKWPLYRADKLAGEAGLVLWGEGEKCADLAAKLGFAATTSVCGAQGFGRTDRASLELLAGRDVVILPDHDLAGAKYAQEVARALQGVAARVRIVDLPGLPEKGDLVDWVSAGGTKEDLLRLLADPSVGACDMADEEEENEESEATWPILHAAALHGIAGRFVRQVGPHSETDPVALLLTFLACAGHVVTSHPHFITEADRQTGALYACLVGQSSRGRKGASLGWVEKVFDLAIETNPHLEESLRLKDIRGLASGEGLLERLKDPEGGARDYHRERLLVIETELAGILQRMGREGSVLSPILRQAWDGKPLENPTKAFPARCSHPHLSLIGHVTKHELLKLFGEAEAFNGLGNRFLWACVRRSKYLPLGGQPPEDDLRALADELGVTLFEAQKRNRLHFTPAAEELWCRVYPILEQEKPTPLADALTARSAAQCVRLAVVYCLLDGGYSIEVPHLLAALAVWDYCEQSVALLHPARRGDLESKVLRALRDAGQGGLTRTELNRVLGGHSKGEQVADVLRRLKSLGHVQEAKCPRPGAAQGLTTSRLFWVDRTPPTVRGFLEEHWAPGLSLPAPPRAVPS